MDGDAVLGALTYALKNLRDLEIYSNLKSPKSELGDLIHKLRHVDERVAHLLNFENLVVAFDLVLVDGILLVPVAEVSFLVFIQRNFVAHGIVEGGASHVAFDRVGSSKIVLSLSAKAASARNVLKFDIAVGKVSANGVHFADLGEKNVEIGFLHVFRKFIGKAALRPSVFDVHDVVVRYRHRRERVLLTAEILRGEKFVAIVRFQRIAVFRVSC